MGEVYQTLRSMSHGKSPSPDGMNVEFYLFYWNLIGGHLFNAISYFFNTGSLPHSWGKTYVALDPKIAHPISVKDFRPISLCNVCYKLISKILDNRLKLVIHTLIGPERSGFIHGCGAIDSIIIGQEIAHNLETELHVPARMLCKIDIKKAFDTIEWPAIITTLQRMLFPANWITWVQSYLSSASFSFIINGHHTP